MSRTRAGLKRLLERYEAPWEIFMIAMAVAFVVLTYVPYWLHFGPSALSTVNKIDWAITAFFALEFAVRFWAAPSRKQYVREHWLDLVAIIPWFRFTRWARLARVARLLRLLVLIRFFRGLDTTFFHLKGIGRQWGFFKFFIATAAVVLVSAEIALASERAVNPRLATYPDALWWAVVTVSTVGYGDVIPLTLTGRLASLAVMLGGIMTWSLFIASATTYFSTRHTQDHDQDRDPIIEELKGKLDRLDDLSEGELIALGGALDALVQSKRQRLQKGGERPPQGASHPESS
ncbi:MAG: ion transporter [Chloroflexi bacterium]|nr:ion transporter [Chloroflexota bacterium]